MSVESQEELQADSLGSDEEEIDRGRGLLLIVDDDRNHAEGSRDALELVGFRCDVAASGAEGIAMLSSMVQWKPSGETPARRSLDENSAL